MTVPTQVDSIGAKASELAAAVGKLQSEIDSTSLAELSDAERDAARGVRKAVQRQLEERLVPAVATLQRAVREAKRAVG